MKASLPGGLRFSGNVSVNTADDFVGQNGRTYDAKGAWSGGEIVGNTQLIVLDAKNLTDDVTKSPTAQCCWIQFGAYASVLTGVSNGKTVTVYRARPCGYWEPTLCDPSDPANADKVVWNLDNGGPQNSMANYESVGIHRKAPPADTLTLDGDYIAIADSPEASNGGMGRAMALDPNSQIWTNPQDVKLAEVSTVTLTDVFEDYLMCGGAPLAEVVWQNNITFNYKTYRTAFSTIQAKNMTDRITQAVQQACVGGSPQYQNITITTKDVAMNAAENALISCKTYPGVQL